MFFSEMGVVSIQSTAMWSLFCLSFSGHWAITLVIAH